ncbi:unnamed protein product [Schistocephalus solidus]|uniref:Uncharacterized protein n=1 Tax=Schistocephalus solidus TaxID=70667 RepID=A0A183SS63_SCHSO|nr:unnamed protein product [Schistocephalus solidus]
MFTCGAPPISSPNGWWSDHSSDKRAPTVKLLPMNSCFQHLSPRTASPLQKAVQEVDDDDDDGDDDEEEEEEQEEEQEKEKAVPNSLSNPSAAIPDAILRENSKYQRKKNLVPVIASLSWKFSSHFVCFDATR